jgi:hypothetical protein
VLEYEEIYSQIAEGMLYALGMKWVSMRWKMRKKLNCCSPASQLSLTLTHLNLLNIANKAALQILFK